MILCINFYINLLFDTSIMIFSTNYNDTIIISWPILLRNFHYFVMVESEFGINLREVGLKLVIT